MSHLEVTPATVMIDWASSPGAWPETGVLPWDNGNFLEAPSIVASPSRSGNGALKVSPGTSVSSIRLRSSNEYPSFDYAIADTTIGLWVYVDLAGPETGNEIVQIYLPNTATTNGSTTNSDAVFFNANHLTKGWEFGARQGWNYLKFSTADPEYSVGTDNNPTTGNKPVPHYIIKWFGTGGTPETNLKSMQISFANFSAGDLVYLDRLEKDHKAETIVMFGWDANSSDLVDIAKAKLDEYGWKGYFVTTEGNTDTTPETDRGTALIAAGWETVNHTRTHLNLATAAQDDFTFENEIGWAFRRINELGWTPAEGVQNFAYPENETSWEAKERIARLFPNIKLARGVVGRWMHFHPLCGSDLVPDPYEVGCFNMGIGHTLDQMIATLNYAELLGTSINFFGHVFETGTPPNASNTAPANPLAVFTDHFQAVVDECGARGLRVMIPTQAEEIAEFGEFGALRRPIIDNISGDLSTATSFNSMRSYIPASAVVRASDTVATIALDGLYGRLNIATDETLSSGDVLSAWTQEDAGNIAITGNPVIEAVEGQIVLLGLASEVSLASAMGPLVKTAHLGLALETDTAQAVTASKPYLIGQALETDTAQSVATTAAVELGQALEADTANALIAAKAATLGQAQETDTAFSVAVGVTVALGQATETDTALPLTTARATQLGLAQEVDTALAIVLNQVRVLGLASETDTAGAMTTSRTALLGLAQETSEALALALGKEYVIGQAVETDTGFAVTVTGGVAGPTAASLRYTIRVEPLHYTLN